MDVNCLLTKDPQVSLRQADEKLCRPPGASAIPGPHYFYAPLEWAKSHCASYITNDAVQKNGDYYYRFYFGDPRDVTMFILRWA
jgi:hypothetical protein